MRQSSGQFAAAGHNHLGQTWTGTGNSLVINGTSHTDDSAPLILSSSGDGLRVESAGYDGIYVGSAGWGIWVNSATNYAAALMGKVDIYGNTNIFGTLYKTSGAFRIDHPLDPENQYLQHSFVESPDMMNIYNGNVTLDDKGEPGWRCRPGSRLSTWSSAIS